MKLISNTAFGQSLKDKSDSDYRRLRDNYDSFLERRLNIGMFVPCDDDGNVLECPGKYSDKKWTEEEMANWGGDVNEHQQAKENVLFEGLFRIEDGFGCWVVIYNDSNSYHVNNKNTIEDLVKYNLTLTQSALKQIGL